MKAIEEEEATHFEKKAPLFDHNSTPRKKSHIIRQDDLDRVMLAKGGPLFVGAVRRPE